VPITPLYLPRGVKTLIVFGGSFDPPHVWHITAPDAVREQLFGARGHVLYIPAGRSPHKKSGPVADATHRLTMLLLALEGARHASVWSDEIDRSEEDPERPSFTIDTLRRLRRVVPARVSLRLLIGMDQAHAFHRWRSPRSIVRIAEPLVMARPPLISAADLVNGLDASFWSAAERSAWCSRLAPNPLGDPNSTSVRRAIPTAPKNSRSWRAHPVLRQVPAPVARYIVACGLYGHRQGA